MSRPYEVQLVLKAASREAAERIVNAALRAAHQPEKEVQMSESVVPPKENVDANGVKMSEADQRDRESAGKSAPVVDIDANRGTKI